MKALSHGKKNAVVVKILAVIKWILMHGIRQASTYGIKEVWFMENKYLGTIVEWDNERWYVDNTDEEFKDDGDETSLFLLPEKYADADENEKLMRNGNPDSVGHWVYKSLVKVIE